MGQSDERPNVSHPPGPGWHPDPADGGRWRWWDGQGWTEDTSDTDASPEPAAAGHVETTPATTFAHGEARRRRWRRRALVAGTVVAGLAAAFSGGAVVGWRLFDERAVAGALGSQEPEVVEIRVPSLDGVADGGAAMPDVRGLDEDAAIEVLADTVLDGDPPVIEQRPWSGPAGLVIEQRPAFGVVDPVAVTLTISEAATVPAAVGRPLADVVEDLSALGSRVEIERRVAEGVDSDTVLEIDPGEGEDLPAVARIVTSEASASIFLAGLPPVEGRCSEGEVQADGTTYQQALTCTARQEPTEVAWLLGRAVERVEGVVGLPDDGPTDLRVRIALVADGEPVAEQTVGYGETVALEAPTADVLRLTLRASIVGEPSRSSTDVVLGDVRLIGSSDGLHSLQGDS